MVQVRETLSILDLDYVSLPCPLEDPLAETLSREGRWRLVPPLPLPTLPPLLTPPPLTDLLLLYHFQA